MPKIDLSAVPFRTSSGARLQLNAWRGIPTWQKRRFERQAA
jgi:hypothetical protein